MSGDALFDAPAAERWRGTRALVLVGHDTCPSCGDAPHREQVDEPALIRHGGHGATRTSVRLHCPCGWTLLLEQTETRP